MRIHIIGICGTGMAALAGLLKVAGHDVRGSDAAPYPPMSDLLAREGIGCLKGYVPENLSWGPEVVVVGNIARRDNPEAVEAQRLGLTLHSLPSALHDFFLVGRTPLVVTGTHGKTTTSSLLAWLLSACGAEPSFFVGGIPRNFGTNHRLGAGPHFVVEGDEYDSAFFDKGPKFLHYAPKVALLTSVEFDHADIYRDLDHVKDAFRKFVALIPRDGTLLVCPAFPHAAEVAQEATCRVLTYGIRGDEHLFAKDLKWTEGSCNFTLVDRGAGLLPEPMYARLPLTGLHNVQNAVGAVGAAVLQGLSPFRVLDALTSFAGVLKRQQVLGEAAGVRVLDDFAHHPTAAAVTLEGLRLGYAPKRLVAAFHFESNSSRRRVFEDDYVAALAQADRVYLSRPLRKADSLRPEDYLDADRVAAGLAARGVAASVYDTVDLMAQALVAELVAGDLFVGMSGRDFEGLHGKVLEGLRGRG